MLFEYTGLDKNGAEQNGTIDTVSEDAAISTLQRNGLIITKIHPAGKGNLFSAEITFLQHVTNKEIVILSRQMATLFEAQVSALRVFRLLGSEASNPLIKKTLLKVADDIQGGMNISKALAKHPNMFSSFYCNMVLAGEESGRLEHTFTHLADYLDRTYAVTSKAKHALVYPAFIIATFITVMALMLTFVIPNLTKMIIDSGVEIPIYTRIVIAISKLFTDYGLFMSIGLAGIIVLIWQYARTEGGRAQIDYLKLKVPGVGNLYKKLYLSRISENLSTMLSSGIAMVQAIDITSAVVENVQYEKALAQAKEDIKNGASISLAFGKHEEIPTIMTQMIRVGEETGELGNILQTLAKFYSREVETAVDTVVGMIEPLMIIMLAGGVGVLVASVLMPIYSVTMSIQ